MAIVEPCEICGGIPSKCGHGGRHSAAIALFDAEIAQLQAEIKRLESIRDGLYAETEQEPPHA